MEPLLLCSNLFQRKLTPSENTLYHNNILSCGWEMAFDSGNNTWDNGASGNYWIYHFEEDVDGDGIIDTPYVIPGAGNQDRFPLVEPWG